MNWSVSVSYIKKEEKKDTGEKNGVNESATRL